MRERFRLQRLRDGPHASPSGYNTRWRYDARGKYAHLFKARATTPQQIPNERSFGTVVRADKAQLSPLQAGTLR
jgi:hypothetical protein